MKGDVKIVFSVFCISSFLRGAGGREEMVGSKGRGKQLKGGSEVASEG